MKKRLFIGLMAAMMVFTMSACGKKQEIAVTEETTENKVEEPQIGAEPLAVEENTVIELGEDEEGAIR